LWQRLVWWRKRSISMDTTKQMVSCTKMFFMLAVILVLVNITASADTSPNYVKPYKVLVVIADQWKDPGSYSIDSESRLCEYLCFKSSHQTGLKRRYVLWLCHPQPAALRGQQINALHHWCLHSRLICCILTVSAKQ
jgi:hypothetical protein